MNIPARFKSAGCFILLLLVSVSCASRRQNTSRLEPGKITQIIVDMNPRGVNHFTPIWSALWLGAIGSGIGTGATAHVIGAGSGVLLGTGAGYLQENHESKRVTRVVEVTADSGVLYRMPIKDNRPLSLGMRVWIAFDSRGHPSHLVAIPST